MERVREGIAVITQKVEEDGITQEHNRIGKRGRGRPRKSVSHNLIEERMNFSNEEVTYPDNLPEFFKIYIPDLSSKMMAIPPDFINKFGGNIPSICTLKKPSGVCWQVDMKRMNDCWFFEKGWPEFVQENSLNDHNVLLFCLVGKSTFSVKIFSQNGCIKGGGGGAEETSSGDDETSESENSEMEGASRRLVRGKMGSVGEISGKPCFSIRMQRTHIDKGIVNVPAEFWSKFMKKDGASSSVVSLVVRNRAWSVGLVTKYKYTVRLVRDFFKFVRDNSLKVGTLCTFQLIHTKPPLTFQVHIHK